MEKKIFLVEDDKFICRAYKEGLIEESFEVEIALDGSEALNKLKKGYRPDLILLDLVMPQKNGFEFLEDIQKRDDLKKIPIIILSNLGQDSDIDKAKKLGAVDYLVKADHSMESVIQKIKNNLKEQTVNQ